ncbi:YjaG family protein [Aliamphritea spongicola]|uniref:YjaG family protein n=1 Tax=Aliamphritea spongicola TaxID=707589 RepID=UPI00196B3630|nr:YjaG family protein [Aliamphritea spongicola]MBN3561869.1 YjaG family protein [Aliamphritea spongicola]
MSQWMLEKEIKALEGWQLTAFSVALTERMYPNFALFSRLLEFGDRHQVRQILDGVWNQLGNTGAKMNFEVQLSNIEDNMPDLDEFDMYGASPALDAMVALFSCVSCLLDNSRAEAANIGNLSLECVATFVEVTAEAQLSDEEVLRLISNHDMMLQEEAFQEEVVRRLNSVKQPNAKFLSELRELASNEGVSNIGVSDD